jgi:hypothetical protein
LSDLFNLPVGLRRWQTEDSLVPQQKDGFEFTLLEDCDNAYRFTAILGAKKVPQLVTAFARFLTEDAFFILEFYPEEVLVSRPSGAYERPAPSVYYSPYLPTAELLRIIRPYLLRMIHDGFVGFGLANNRKGLELFYSEEKVMTFFTDNHLRLCDFLQQQQISHCASLILPADFGHDHLSLLSGPRDQLPEELASLKDKELDSVTFCRELVEILDMYPVEEGLSFFLTRKEQDQIAALLQQIAPDDEFASAEFGSLLLDWSDFVSECKNAFEGDLWEYRQGLKIRDTIQLVAEAAPQPLADKIVSIVSEPDAEFQEILTDRRKRLDPPAAPKLQQERFWYQGMVRNQGTDLRRDLIRQGWFQG